MVLRILLADDHALVRAGFRSLLQEIPNIEVVAEAGNGVEALQRIGEHLPDLALLDIAMEGLNGLEVAARVAKDFPSVWTLMLSMHATEEYVRRALRAGARGYLLKDVEPEELRRAIETIQRGEFYLSPGLSRQVISALVHAEGAVPGPLDRLTPRQRQVLQLLAEGFKTKEIARTLGIGLRTVETYRAQIMQQLGIHDVVSLVHFAIREGLVKPH
jgi:DNA-binding NarL/FixJ family response regulator